MANKHCSGFCQGQQCLQGNLPADAHAFWPVSLSDGVSAGQAVLSGMWLELLG